MPEKWQTYQTSSTSITPEYSAKWSSFRATRATRKSRATGLNWSFSVEQVISVTKKWPLVTFNDFIDENDSKICQQGYILAKLTF